MRVCLKCKKNVVEIGICDECKKKCNFCLEYPHEKHHLCAKHCTEKDHGHCSEFFCKKNPHFENKCKKHCKYPGHGHCIRTCKINALKLYCEKHEEQEKGIDVPCVRCTFVRHEGSNMCIKHCNIRDHGHCSRMNCKKMEHKDSRCIPHCLSCPKIHCSKPECGNENLCCRLCFDCCKDKTHQKK